MTSGVAFSEDLRGVLVFMHIDAGLDAKTISHLTGIPLRTVYRFLSTWRLTGKVKPAPEGKRGRPRVLDFADTQVSSIIYPNVVETHLRSSEVPTTCRDSSQRSIPPGAPGRTRRTLRCESLGLYDLENSATRRFSIERGECSVCYCRTLLTLLRSQNMPQSVTSIFAQNIASPLGKTTSPNSWSLLTKALVIVGPIFAAELGHSKAFVRAGSNILLGDVGM